MTANPEAVDLARIAAVAAEDKLANDVVIIDVSDRLAITACFVIASAPNERHVNAVVEAVDEAIRRAGHKVVRREGERSGRWALLDAVDVVVHVQHVEERDFYSLDRLWKDCPKIGFATGDPRSNAGDRVQGDSVVLGDEVQGAPSRGVLESGGVHEARSNAGDRVQGTEDEEA